MREKLVFFIFTTLLSVNSFGQEFELGGSVSIGTRFAIDENLNRKAWPGANLRARQNLSKSFSLSLGGSYFSPAVPFEYWVNLYQLNLNLQFNFLPSKKIGVNGFLGLNNTYEKLLDVAGESDFSNNYIGYEIGINIHSHKGFFVEVKREKYLNQFQFSFGYLYIFKNS